MSQVKVNELPSKFKLTISQATEGIRVSAPLPEDFGFTVGSVFSTPFDTLTLSETAAKLFAVGGISQKAAFNMEKLYINPEPTEISFDMVFDAYHDAAEDVLKPVINLLNMGLSTRYDNEALRNSLQNILDKVTAPLDVVGIVDVDRNDLREKTNEVTEKNSEISGKVLDILNLMKGPETVTVHFGDVFRINKAFISSIGVQFSNVLDSRGIPMSATCPVTLVLQNVPLRETINGSNESRGWFDIKRDS